MNNKNNPNNRSSHTEPLTLAIIATSAALIITVALTVIYGWVLMLVVGALHSYTAAIPAIGFLPSFGIACLVFAIAPFHRKS